MGIDIHNDRILVTGASGSLGKQLIYELNKQGVKPIAHVRESSDTSFVDSLGLEKRVADLRFPKAFPELLSGIDIVVHTAAWVDFREDRLTQFTGINAIAPLDLFKASQEAGVKRFVHVSSIAAVGAFDRREVEHDATEFDLINENSHFNLEGLHIPYIMTKRAAEVELQKVSSPGKTELIMVNPSIIIAPVASGDDRKRVMRAFSKFVIPEFPVRVNLVDIRDVAPGVVAAMEKGRHGERYILAGDNVVASDLSLAISAVLGKIPHLVRFPRPMYDFFARVSVTFNKLLGRGNIRIYPDLVKLLDYDWAYSSKKAREELGYQSRSIYTTLDDLLTNNFTGTYLKPGIEQYSGR
jgi:dihydroflavonol-4-reductase